MINQEGKYLLQYGTDVESYSQVVVGVQILKNNLETKHLLTHTHIHTYTVMVV